MILKFEFCDFSEFFSIIKKASRGPYAADLDHYGRGQTRSEWGACDQVSSKSVKVEG